jgi:hypothetical protein
MSILFVIVLTFLVTSLFGHTIHWALHQPWSGKVHKAHMTHHLKLYPPTDFTSEVYRDAGRDSTPKFFLIAAMPLILAPIVLCVLGIISWQIMLTILIVEGLMGFLHDYLHDAFHIKGHWLYGIPLIGRWFRNLVKLHYLHHVDMSSNFGIFTFHWDQILGSFRAK